MNNKAFICAWLFLSEEHINMTKVAGWLLSSTVLQMKYICISGTSKRRT